VICQRNVRILLFPSRILFVVELSPNKRGHQGNLRSGAGRAGSIGLSSLSSLITMVSERPLFEEGAPYPETVVQQA
jgi:hypothetical protein